MIVKGTDKIKGMLQLASIKREIAKGRVLHLNSSDYRSPDVQTALHMGFIESVKGEDPKDVIAGKTEGIDRQIICKSLSDRPFTIPGTLAEIKKNMIFSVNETELNSELFRTIIAKGMMEIVKVDNSRKSSKGSMKISKKIESIEEVQQPTITKHIKQLDTNEEINVVKVIEDPNDIPIDPKRNTVIFHPDGKKYNQDVVVVQNPLQSALVAENKEIEITGEINPTSVNSEPTTKPIVVNPQNKKIPSQEDKDKLLSNFLKPTTDQKKRETHESRPITLNYNDNKIKSVGVFTPEGFIPAAAIQKKAGKAQIKKNTNKEPNNE